MYFANLYFIIICKAVANSLHNLLTSYIPATGQHTQFSKIVFIREVDDAYVPTRLLIATQVK